MVDKDFSQNLFYKLIGLPTYKRVCALTAGEIVSGERVVAYATAQQIVAIVAPNLIVTCTPKEPIVTRFTADSVIACATVALVEKIAESNRRFDILRAEAITDRQRSDKRFEVLSAEATADRQRSDQLRAESSSRFEESSRRFDAQLSEIRAQGEQIRALLSALANTNERVDTLEQAG